MIKVAPSQLLLLLFVIDPINQRCETHHDILCPQGNPLYHNPATGTIISNQSLVLQSVTRSRAGIYTCIGSNQEGDGESNPLNLDIKCEPYISFIVERQNIKFQYQATLVLKLMVKIICVEDENCSSTVPSEDSTMLKNVSFTDEATFTNHVCEIKSLDRGYKRDKMGRGILTMTKQYEKAKRRTSDEKVQEEMMYPSVEIDGLQDYNIFPTAEYYYRKFRTTKEETKQDNKLSKLDFFSWLAVIFKVRVTDKEREQRELNRRKGERKGGWMQEGLIGKSLTISWMTEQRGLGQRMYLYVQVGWLVHQIENITPVCHHGQIKVFGVARQETARIPCELEANPPEVTFTWKFNNTMEAIDIPQAHVASERTRSTASYTPMTELDYGTLLCWGTNDQGTQLEPCVYHIVPAGESTIDYCNRASVQTEINIGWSLKERLNDKHRTAKESNYTRDFELGATNAPGHPDTPHNCSLLNQTTDSLYVECTEGFDGGLPQKFTIQVDREAGTSSTSSKPSTTVYNQTSKVPSFSVGNLEPGTTYDVHIYASNSKGWCVVPGMVGAGERLAQPPPPENCTIREESRTTVRVSCAESEYIDPRTATYVLQVYDADNRRLLASATSMTPSMLEITDLPAERSYSGLVLSLRIMTEHAMSEATVLYSPHFVQEGKTQEHQRYPALTPVMLSLSGPLLGAVVGATAGLLLVIFVIVLAVRLRYRPRSQEDKDSHDDGGMANLAASGTGSSSPRDKSSTLPLNSDSIESFEKDPDIIPHANGGHLEFCVPAENSYAELCKGTSPRYVLHQQRTDPNAFTNTSNGSELTYAELSLRNRRIPPNCYQPVQVSNIQRPQLLAMSTLTRRQPIQEPTIYAQVASHSKPIYVPPPHPYMSRTNDETTAETPLIGHDNKVTIGRPVPSFVSDNELISAALETPKLSTLISNIEIKNERDGVMINVRKRCELKETARKQQQRGKEEKERAEEQR
ncbi:hypothetical protein WN51_12361 [Melipona quadrifasciata]|uniref:Nephrin n=1 Tax=Melipona quadrifasciata TaxID=166423 RepID=A0A0N0BH95_9HYME|nr:hypothetical protein WN51_12361 [Melipona quadrifasciata]